MKENSDHGLIRPWYKDRHGNKVQTKTWYVREGVNGQMIYRTTSTDNLRKAKQIKKKILGEAANGRLLTGEAERTTLEDLIAKEEVVKVMVPRNLADQKRDRERTEKIAKAIEEKKQQLSEEATREATAELAKALPLARRGCAPAPWSGRG